MYCSVNGIQLYYEVSGAGDPVILLHGNSESHEIFDKVSEPLSKDHTVYLVDSRCHGKSTKTKEIGYDMMASDMIEFIKTLKIEKPVFYGFSDGGIIGLLIAIREPDLLKQLIISGANLNPKGMKFSILVSTWLVAIRGNRLFKMMLQEPDIQPESLRKIRIPTVVLAGEKDVIKRKHTEMIADNIKGSKLWIIPKEHHGSYIVHSTKLYDILKKYL